MTASDKTTITAVRQHVVEAADRQLVEVVALIDAMSDRGSADALVVPVRARLKQLRLRRPLRFSRLLFLPLDSVIVPGAEWRRAAIGVPRTAINPISEAIRGELGAATRDIDAIIRDRAVDECDAVLEAGSRLWPHAAERIADGPVPNNWNMHTGLQAEDYKAIAARLRWVWSEAIAIERLASEPCEAETHIEAVATILREPAAAGGQPLNLMLEVLLKRLPDQAGVLRALRVVATSRRGDKAADADTALRAMLDRLDVDAERGAQEVFGGHGWPSAGVAVSRAASLLDALSDEIRTPDGLKRIDAIRRKLDVACRRRFVGQLGDILLAPLDRCATTASATEVETLETNARELRRFEAASRRLGGGETYDAALRAAANRIAALNGSGADAGLTLADRARLVEIICGPEAALALLDAN